VGERRVDVTDSSESGQHRQAAEGFRPVVKVHVLFRAEFERRREQGNPFVRNALEEGRSYA